MAGVIALGMFLARISWIAAILAAFVTFVMLVRRPFERKSIQKASPEASEQEVETMLKTSQRRFGVAIWLLIFLLPMLVLAGIMYVNSVSVRVG
jgi:amino acid transporter